MGVAVANKVIEIILKPARDHNNAALSIRGNNLTAKVLSKNAPIT